MDQRKYQVFGYYLGYIIELVEPLGLDYITVLRWQHLSHGKMKFDQFLPVGISTQFCHRMLGSQMSHRPIHSNHLVLDLSQPDVLGETDLVTHKNGTFMQSLPAIKSPIKKVLFVCGGLKNFG